MQGNWGLCEAIQRHTQKNELSCMSEMHAGNTHKSLTSPVLCLHQASLGLILVSSSAKCHHSSSALTNSNLCRRWFSKYSRSHRWSLSHTVLCGPRLCCGWVWSLQTNSTMMSVATVGLRSCSRLRQCRHICDVAGIPIWPTNKQTNSPDLVMFQGQRVCKEAKQNLNPLLPSSDFVKQSRKCILSKLWRDMSSQLETLNFRTFQRKETHSQQVGQNIPTIWVHPVFPWNEQLHKSPVRFIWGGAMPSIGLYTRHSPALAIPSRPFYTINIKHFFLSSNWKTSQILIIILPNQRGRTLSEENFIWTHWECEPFYATVQNFKEKSFTAHFFLIDAYLRKKKKIKSFQW